jgi:hypothetical protein
MPGVVSRIFDRWCNVLFLFSGGDDSSLLLLFVPRSRTGHFDDSFLSELGSLTTVVELHAIEPNAGLDRIIGAVWRGNCVLYITSSFSFTSISFH